MCNKKSNFLNEAILGFIKALRGKKAYNKRNLNLLLPRKIYIFTLDALIKSKGLLSAGNASLALTVNIRKYTPSSRGLSGTTLHIDDHNNIRYH